MSLVTGPAKITINQVTIVDGQAAKSITLMPDQKFAVSMDMKKMREDMKKSAKGAPPDLFEMVRRLVREGSSGTGEKAERLGKKEIDGREAVGFRTHANMMDMTLWADPETAWPIRIEIVMDVMAEVRMVMHNFRYNVDLDPSLFSLEPPAGYSTQVVEASLFGKRYNRVRPRLPARRIHRRPCSTENTGISVARRGLWNQSS